MKIFAVVACMAVAAPAGAIAKRGAEKGGKGKAPRAKLVSANVKGIVTGHDAGKLAVTVKKASGQAKACKGRELTFDVSKARFRTPDHNADGKKDSADVLVGHAVKVQGKVSLTKGRKATCSVADDQVLPAKRVENRTKRSKPDTGDETSDDVREEAPALHEDEAAEEDLGPEGDDTLDWGDDSVEGEDDDESLDDYDYLGADSDLEGESVEEDF